MKKNKTINPEKRIMKHENHRRPVTRRDFLSLGIGAAAGYAVVPGVIDMLYHKLLAAEGCSPLAAGNLVPLIMLDLPGGAPLGANVLVGGPAGQLDKISNYDNWGIPAAKSPNATGFNPNTSYGLAMYNDAGFKMGLDAGIPNAATRANVDGFIILSNWNDDTSNNLGNPVQWIAKVGGRSGALRPTFGTSLTASGGNTKAALGGEYSDTRPARVRSANELRALVSRGRLAEVLNDDNKFFKVTSFIDRMSQSQLIKFSNLQLSDQTKVLIECGYVNANNLFQDFQPNNVFPQTTPADITAAFGAGADNNPTAVIAHAVLNDLVGAATIEVPDGFDSHNDTAASYRQDAFRAGLHAGRIISLAAARGKAISIGVITDGSMGATITPGSEDNSAGAGGQPGGDGYWRRPGDGGQYNASIFLTYVPGSAQGSLIQNVGRQIGSATTNGTNQNDGLVTTTPTNVALAMLKNWGHLNGLDDVVQKATGSDVFAGNDAKYRMLKKKP